MKGRKDNAQELFNQICKAEGVTFNDKQIVAISKFVDKINDNLQRMWNTVHDVEDELWELRKFKENTRPAPIDVDRMCEEIDSLITGGAQHSTRSVADMSKKKKSFTAYATYNKKTKKIAFDWCPFNPLLIYKHKYDCHNFRLKFDSYYEIRKVRIMLE